VGQNQPVLVNGRKRHLDVAVLKRDRLRCAVEVKVWLTNGRKDLNALFDLMDVLHQEHADLRALLVAFGELETGEGARATTVVSALQESKRQPWFTYISLRDNQEKRISDLLDSALGLGSLLPATK
jgi:hypothetical protein